MKNQIITWLRTGWVLALLVALPLAATLDRGPEESEPAVPAAAGELPSAELATLGAGPVRLRADRPAPAPLTAGALTEEEPLAGWRR